MLISGLKMDTSLAVLLGVIIINRIDKKEMSDSFLA